MKKLLLFLLLTPLLFYGQTRTVDNLGVETITFGKIIQYKHVCSQIKMNFFAQNLREVSANLVKNFDTVFF